MKCALCYKQNLSLLHQYISKYNNKLYNRIYYLCSQCELISLEGSLRLCLEEEKYRYSQHNNSIEDHNYLKFLDKLVSKLSPYLKKTDSGLDYGCGPSVVLAKYLSQKGFQTQYYDPLFFPNPKAFTKQYNFITCTETVEHFYHPFVEYQKINDLLKANGYIGIMTKLYEQPKDFSGWYYHKDITHVSFYTKNTMHWIAKHLNWKIIFLSSQVIIFQKQSGTF